METVFAAILRAGALAGGVTYILAASHLATMLAALERALLWTR